MELIKYLASIALTVIALSLGVYSVVSSAITAKCESYASKKETDYSVSMAVCYIKSGDKWLTLDEYSKAEIGDKITVDRGEL